jgi:hypothetical protein
VCGQDVILHYQPREINCPTHGRAQERIPWAEPYAQVTYRFEYLMLRLCRNMPQSEACTQLNCPPSTLSGILRRTIRRIWRAWVLKDEFERFWDYSYPGAARGFITRWTRTALRSRLAPMRAFVKTLRNHLEDILSFIDTRLTNAAAEGINRIIRMVKNRASGFGNLDSFIDLIYLRVGDVDIPEQIPLGFRTL